MIGGDVIGQGTYGCAVVPPLLCKGRARQERREIGKAKSKNSEKVGKVTLLMDADTELQISKTLREEKLWKNYFILPELDACEPVSQKRIMNWESCAITSQFGKNQLRQLVSDFGGTSFSSLGGVDLSPKKFNFFSFMRHTLEATALLTLRGVVHFDLHRSNILIDDHGVPRLLDFGMSFRESDLSEEILNFRWKQYDPKFDSEPPEVTVITGLRNSMELRPAITDCIMNKPVYKEYELMFSKPRKELEQRFLDFCLKSKSFQKKDWVEFFKIYWPGFDSFALGAIFLNILKIQLTWNDFAESKEWAKRHETIYTLIQGMLDPDPSQRLDCVESLELYEPDSVVLKNSAAWLSARKAQRAE